MNCLEKNYKVCEVKNLEIGDFILTESGPVKIKSIKSAGEGNCYDITLLKDSNLFNNEPNFILGNGVVSHNCNLPVIDDCIKLIKQNRGIEIKKEDIPIDDKESIKLGTKGDLLGIFQFENPYTKKISDMVGVDSLADISAITSLIRPGPKDVGLDIEYAERKNGKKYEKNEALDKVLGETYSVLTYQEQVIFLAVQIAGFTPLEGNALRKAIGKKKADLMASMKQKFIEGGKNNLNKTKLKEEELSKIWDYIESMAGYAFNKCISGDSVVEKEDGFCLLSELKVGDFIKTPTGFSEVKNVFHQGEKEVFKFVLSDGKEIKCTMEHKFLCDDGSIRPILEILQKDLKIITDE